MPKDKPSPNQTGSPTKVNTDLQPKTQAKADAVNAFGKSQGTVRLQNRMVRTRSRNFKLN
jgi:hypothetical protein